MMRHSPRRPRGFTLVEMLIAIVILVIVGGMTVVMFRGTQQSFMRARAFQHVIDVARQVVMRMHDEIKAAYVEPSGIVSLVGITATGTKVKTDSAADEVFFIAAQGARTANDIGEIGYWQKADGNLMRHYACPPDYTYTTADSDDPLGLVVSDFTVTYFDGSTYLPSWDSRSGGAQEGKFPTVIEFSFSVSDTSGVLTKKFGSKVHIASSGR